jgi:hypothetical protein
LGWFSFPVRSRGGGGGGGGLVCTCGQLFVFPPSSGFFLSLNKLPPVSISDQALAAAVWAGFLSLFAPAAAAAAAVAWFVHVASSLLFCHFLFSYYRSLDSILSCLSLHPIPPRLHRCVARVELRL